MNRTTTQFLFGRLLPGKLSESPLLKPKPTARLKSLALGSLCVSSMARLFTLVILLGSTSMLSAQMNGTYTLNASAAASSTNFTNWQSFWRSLSGLSRSDLGPTLTGGVNGPVVLNVMSSVTETQPVQFPIVTGASATNTITINGGGNVLSYAGTTTLNAAITLSGTDYLTLRNLTIRNTANITQVMGIRLFGGADYNVIENNTIEFSALTLGSSTAGGAYVAFSSATSLTGVTAGGGNNGNFNLVRNNLMRTTNVNSPGPAYGIFEVQNISNYTSVHSNNTFDRNTIQNFFFWGINTYYTNGTLITGNDISRANVSTGLPNSTSGGINSYYNAATNRIIRADSNFIHDLPFLGSAPSGSNSFMHGMYVWYWFGTTTNPFSIKSNTLLNITSASAGQGVYEAYSTNGNIELNRIENIRNNANSVVYSIYSIFGSSKNIISNTIQKNRPFGTYYGIYTLSIGGTSNRVNDNIIMDNESTVTGTYHILYGIFTANGNIEVQRNLVYNLKQVSTSGIIYALRTQLSGGDHLYANNVVSNCGGAGATYGFYHSTNSNNLIFRQNTLNLTTTGGGSSFHYQYGIFGFGNGSTTIDGNIVVTSNSYGVYPVYYAGTTNPQPNFRHNTYWASNFTLQFWYNPAMGTRNTFADWRNSAFANMDAEIFANPMLRNPNAMDFSAGSFLAHNNVPEDNRVTTDFTKRTRNTIVCDRGAISTVMDLESSAASYNGGTNPCTGYSEKLKLTIKNNFSDTARNFWMAFSLNGRMMQRQLVTTRIAPGQSSVQEFVNPLQLSNSGSQRLVVYLMNPDDIRSNDSQVFQLNVRKSPGGSKVVASSQATNAVYQSTKNFDVTVVGQSAIYDVSAPTNFTNGNYGSAWTASVYAEMQSGQLRSSSETKLTAPSGSNMGVSYTTSDKNIEDSTITLCIKVTDLVNGCDTILRRRILVYPSISPDFEFPSRICDQEEVAFINKSTVKSGFMEFKWNFGTGVAADTSDAPEPVFQFPKPGTYWVKMTAKTKPYGFAFYDSAQVVINQIPTVAFTKVNACSGINLQFTNRTTPSNSTYRWEFGDGTFSTATSPAKSYTKAGVYNVKLTATLNGCVASSTQRVYQFEKPKADFKLSEGTCQNDRFQFENLSSIKDGFVGSKWDFDNGVVSTEENPAITFTTAGTKNVKLTTTSEFGCVDSKVVPVTVAESPIAEFTNDPACSVTPTSFTNTTAATNSAVSSYTWNFGDGSTSTAENPVKTWSNLGPKNVSLTVVLANGCKSSFSKKLNVGVEPVVLFNAQNVCAGEAVTFENNSRWPQGDISFSWNFGDNTSSTNSDPRHIYNTSVTKTYNVTLKASIAGGCEASLTKPVTVNQGPTTCDFIANPDYAFGFHGMRFDPINGAGNQVVENGVTYTWVFDGGGTQKGGTTNYNFQVDGVYNVTMRARVDATGCECSKSRTVVMNRTQVTAPEDMGMAVYPNPSNGQFTVALAENFGSKVTVEVHSLSGALINTFVAENTGAINVDAGDVAEGIYLLRVSSDSRVLTQKIKIQK
jgi:PKD repeat protein